MIINAKVIFWDFDGVIKESVEVKSDAFEKLFLPFGVKVAEKVKKHHLENGGVSRFDKLPMYLNWANQESSELMVGKYSEMFSKLVKQEVIESEWVTGVLDYLEKNYITQQFFLVTATPQQEIEDILFCLNIKHYFQNIIGSPTAKKDAIKSLLNNYKINTKKAIMIGDTFSDYSASMDNKLPFVLRKTRHNKTLQRQLNCNMINDFLNLSFPR